MDSEKKEYKKPSVIVHGDIEKITQHGGTRLSDVPIGTPVDAS